jgi:hypothetical protein
MRFLVKNNESPIFREGLTYQEDRTDNNKKICDALLIEQRGFCAYTEWYLKRTDSPEVEHFNPALKYRDDYFNYYAVSRNANQRKLKRHKKEEFKTAAFMTSLFFQKAKELFSRIRYVPEDHVYDAIDRDDQDALLLIEYLGMNDYALVEDRRQHAERVIATCTEHDWSQDTILSYFKKNPAELSFITDLELGLSMDLSPAIPEKPIVLDTEGQIPI